MNFQDNSAAMTAGSVQTLYGCVAYGFEHERLPSEKLVIMWPPLPSSRLLSHAMSLH
jgi:hypothetical protein